MLSLIAAIGENGELGYKGDLCFHIREDMKFFRNTTMGHKVLMGRKTWESLPTGGLPGRENIVVSRNEMRGVDWVVNDLEWFLKENANTEEEIFVIGGGMIYATALPYAKQLYLTEVEAVAEADTFFPDFDRTKYTREVIREGEEDGLKYKIVKYTKEA